MIPKGSALQTLSIQMSVDTPDQAVDQKAAKIQMIQIVNARLTGHRKRRVKKNRGHSNNSISTCVITEARMCPEDICTGAIPELPMATQSFASSLAEVFPPTSSTIYPTHPLSFSSEFFKKRRSWHCLCFPAGVESMSTSQYCVVCFRQDDVAGQDMILNTERHQDRRR